MAEELREYQVALLGIPALTVRYTSLNGGHKRYFVFETKETSGVKLENLVTNSNRSVAVIAGHSEFGPLIFRKPFLERYPLLREVTVLRKPNKKFVFIKQPFEHHGSTQYAPKHIPTLSALTASIDLEASANARTNEADFHASIHGIDCTTPSPGSDLKNEPAPSARSSQANAERTAPCEYYIGLMSGTSIDSLDGVLVSITPKAQGVHLKTLATTTLDWKPEAKELLNSLCTQESKVIDLALGRQLLAAQASLVVQRLLNKTQLKAKNITAIGSHGQTIWHAPEQKSLLTERLKRCLPTVPGVDALHLGFSLQIDNGPLLANSTEIDTVSDFRSADLAQGGQGAPLTQAFHQMIFGEAGKMRLVLNLGGIANLTVLDHDCQLVTAYDTGPANTLIDLYCRHVVGCPYDQSGDFARAGKVNLEQLKALLDCDYFARPAPKSTGRELFNAHYLQDKLGLTLPPVKTLQPATKCTPTPEQCDLIATLTEFTARTIRSQICAQTLVAQRVAPGEHVDLIVCGGGAFNSYLLLRIKQLCAKQGLSLDLHHSADFGIDPKFIEAQAFAYFAYCTVHALPLNLGTSTGAVAPSILGSLSPAPHGHYQRNVRRLVRLINCPSN